MLGVALPSSRQMKGHTMNELTTEQRYERDMLFDVLRGDRLMVVEGDQLMCWHCAREQAKSIMQAIRAGEVSCLRPMVVVQEIRPASACDRDDISECEWCGREFGQLDG